MTYCEAGISGPIIETTRTGYWEPVGLSDFLEELTEFPYPRSTIKSLKPTLGTSAGLSHIFYAKSHPSLALVPKLDCPKLEEGRDVQYLFRVLTMWLLL
jgi:hypothetical protein